MIWTINLSSSLILSLVSCCFLGVCIQMFLCTSSILLLSCLSILLGESVFLRWLMQGKGISILPLTPSLMVSSCTWKGTFRLICPLRKAKLIQTNQPTCWLHPWLHVYWRETTVHCDIKERVTPETKYLFILLCNRLLLISYFVLGTEHGTGELMVKTPQKNRNRLWL